MRNMHVVLIEFRNSTPYPVQLANALSNECRVTLMLPKSAARFADYLDRTRVRLEFFDFPKMRQLSNLGMILRMRKRLKELSPDVVHITFWHIWGTPGLGIRSPIPVVATVHDVYRHSGERGLWAVPPSMYPMQWNWADEVIVHAGSAQEALEKDFGVPRQHVHVNPIGIYDYYKRIHPNSYPERSNTVLFFGRIWGYKGLEYLIRAEPYISEVIPDLRIVIAGEAEDFSPYERLIANNDRFEVHNYRIPDQKVSYLFQSASLVALPYVDASQSGVVPIAYAFGKPVVATNVGGLPDVVLHGETGFLVNPANPGELAEAIVTMLGNPQLRNQMSANIVELAETSLSWDAIAKSTVNIYETMLSNGNR